MIKLSSIKANPNNPRLIKDDKFKQLVTSIKEFPKMMALRPMVVDENNTVLGGNMRLKALQELGYKQIDNTWVAKAKDLTPDEIRRFIVVDNVGFGEHDWDELTNNWDMEELKEWGAGNTIFFSQEDEPDETISFDETKFNNSADSYLNNSIRQVVLYYDVETHKNTLEKLKNIGEKYNIEEDNSTVVLKLIELYESQDN